MKERDEKGHKVHRMGVGKTHDGPMQIGTNMEI